MLKDKKLDKLLIKAADALCEAQAARYEVEEYLEENYIFDRLNDYDKITDEYEWCNGLDWDKISDIIEGGNNNEMR